jgi:hypothetical protein
MSDEWQGELFAADPDLAPEPAAGAAVAVGVARVLWPNRGQLELRPCELESLLPEGHRALQVWAWSSAAISPPSFVSS